MKRSISRDPKSEGTLAPAPLSFRAQPGKAFLIPRKAPPGATPERRGAGEVPPVAVYYK